MVYSYTVSFTAHAVLVAADVVLAVLCVPSVVHVVATWRSGKEGILECEVNLRTDHNIKGSMKRFCTYIPRSMTRYPLQDVQKSATSYRCRSRTIRG